MKKEIEDEFIQLALALEPERLYQDGEASQEEANEMARKIQARWSTLEKLHGKPVSLEKIEAIAWNR